MHDLQLQTVGIVEEHGVVAGLVPVLLGAALDLGALLPEPVGALVDGLPRGGLDREVVQADAEIESGPEEYPYSPGYYAVFFADADGIKLEIVHNP